MDVRAALEECISNQTSGELHHQGPGQDGLSMGQCNHTQITTSKQGSRMASVPRRPACGCPSRTLTARAATASAKLKRRRIASTCLNDQQRGSAGSRKSQEPHAGACPIHTNAKAAQNKTIVRPGNAVQPAAATRNAPRQSGRRAEETTQNFVWVDGAERRRARRALLRIRGHGLGNKHTHQGNAWRKKNSTSWRLPASLRHKASTQPNHKIAAAEASTQPNHKLAAAAKGAVGQSEAQTTTRAPHSDTPTQAGESITS